MKHFYHPNFQVFLDVICFLVFFTTVLAQSLVTKDFSDIWVTLIYPAKLLVYALSYLSTPNAQLKNDYDFGFKLFTVRTVFDSLAVTLYTTLMLLSHVQVTTVIMFYAITFLEVCASITSLYVLV